MLPIVCPLLFILFIECVLVFRCRLKAQRLDSVCLLYMSLCAGGFCGNHRALFLAPWRSYLLTTTHPPTHPSTLVLRTPAQSNRA